MIIDSIRNYIRGCPLINKGKVNVDYLGVDIGEYSIEPTPADPIIKRYADGGTLRQYLFVFSSKESYGPDIRVQIDNSGFYEKFGQWLEKQTSENNLPDLNNKKTSQWVEALTGGYLFENETDTAKYQIQCRLVYYQDY